MHSSPVREMRKRKPIQYTYAVRYLEIHGNNLLRMLQNNTIHTHTNADEIIIYVFVY